MLDQADLRKVTTELENGNASSLPGLLHGNFLEDRIDTLKAIQQLNQADQKTNANVPDLGLMISTSFAGTDTLSLFRSEHNAHDGFFGGQQIYSDTLDLDKLTYSTPGDSAPATNTKVDVRALTTQLENGDGTGVAKMLGGLHEEERVQVFHDVEKLNQDDLAQHKTTASLGILIQPDKVGDNDIDVTRALPGGHDSFFGGQAIYHDELNIETGQRTTNEYKDTRKA